MKFLPITLFLIIAITISLAVPAQVLASTNPDIDAIQTLYAASLADIASGSVYHNQYVANKDNKSWRALGAFKETIDVYYNDTMVMDGEIPIVKINVKTQEAATSSTEEYLFNNKGELVFVHYVSTVFDLDAPNNSRPLDRRYYYKNGKVIRFMQDKQIYGGQNMPQDPNESSIRQTAESLYQKGLRIWQFTMLYIE